MIVPALQGRENAAGSLPLEPVEEIHCAVFYVPADFPYVTRKSLRIAQAIQGFVRVFLEMLGGFVKSLLLFYVFTIAIRVIS